MEQRCPHQKSGEQGEQPNFETLHYLMADNKKNLCPVRKGTLPEAGRARAGVTTATGEEVFRKEQKSSQNLTDFKNQPVVCKLCPTASGWWSGLGG